MLFEHFLIMSHWSLTWWAPSSPEINKQNIALFVFDAYWSFVVLKGGNISDSLVHITSVDGTDNTHFDSLISFNDWLDSSIESISLGLFGGWKLLLDTQGCSTLDISSCELSNLFSVDADFSVLEAIVL